MLGSPVIIRTPAARNTETGSLPCSRALAEADEDFDTSCVDALIAVDGGRAQSCY
jgi:hypothetical protein